MSATDRRYFAHRAEQEKGAALKAKDMASFRAHMGMSREYEHRAHGFEPSRAVRIAPDYSSPEENSRGSTEG